MITRTAFMRLLICAALVAPAADTIVFEKQAYAEDGVNESGPSVPAAQTAEKVEEQTEQPVEKEEKTLEATDLSTTANDTIVEIDTAADLDSIASDLGGHFRLTSDIDASGYTRLSTETFTGTLDGGGHRITGLDGTVPLFAALNGAAISDLEIPIYSSSAGVRAAFAVGVTNSALRNLILSNADLHYSLPDGADPNGQDGALFSTVSDSTIQNLQLNIPSLTWDKGFAATGILAKDLTRVNMDQVFFGDLTLHGRGSFIAGTSVLAGNVTDLTVSKATGNITLSSFGSVYGFGILGARTKGTMNVKDSALNLRLVDVEAAYSTATLFSRSVDADYKKWPTTIHVESSSLGFESSNSATQLAQVSTTSGSDAGDQTAVNIRNSQITFHVPDSKKIQNSAAGALDGGIFEHNDFKIDMVSDSLFIVGGASLNLNESIDNTFAVDLKSRREMFNVSGVVQGPLNRMSGGTVKVTIHSDVPNDANVMFVAGIAYAGNIIQDTTADIRITAKPSNDSTNKGVTFVHGLFASAAASAPDGLTFRNLTAHIDMDIHMPKNQSYSGYYGMAPNVFALADSRIEARMRVAGTDLSQVYLIHTLKEASNNELSFDFEGNISGQASAIVPIQEYGKAEHNIFNFSTSVQADDLNNVYGLAATGNDSIDNTFNIKLHQQATTIRDAYGLMSVLNGSFENNTVNAEIVMNSTQQERTHLISRISSKAWMRNNTMKVTGSLTGVSDWWVYSLFSSIADTADIENLAIQKDLRLHTGTSPKAELVRYISNAAVKGLAFQSANEPLPFEAEVGTDSAGTYTDTMSYRDSYFIYPEQNEYFKVLPAYIAMKDSYVRFSDTDAGIFFSDKANAVSDMLSMDQYGELDPDLWQKQTTNGIDSPRLAWLMAQEPNVLPEGKFENGQVTVSWQGNDSGTAYTAWQEGEPDSVQKVYGSKKAIFTVPNTAKEVRTYKVAQVGNWGIAVPQNEYAYDPAAIASPTPALPESPPVTAPTEANPPLEVKPAEEQGGNPEAEERPKYIDVPKEHFAYQEITELDAKGVIKGYIDRSFRPDASITRAEFAVMLARAFQAPPSEAAFYFDDLAKGSWYDEPLQAALAAGITKGFNDGKYRPLHPIPREQAVIMVTNLLRQHNIYKNRAIRFTDLKKAVEWSRYAVVSAASAGAIEGYPDGTFRPKAAITRAEAAVIVKRLLKILDR